MTARRLSTMAEHEIDVWLCQLSDLLEADYYRPHEALVWPASFSVEEITDIIRTTQAAGDPRGSPWAATVNRARTDGSLTTGGLDQITGTFHKFGPKKDGKQCYLLTDASVGAINARVGVLCSQNEYVFNALSKTKPNAVAVKTTGIPVYTERSNLKPGTQIIEKRQTLKVTTAHSEFKGKEALDIASKDALEFEMKTPDGKQLLMPKTNTIALVMAPCIHPGHGFNRTQLCFDKKLRFIVKTWFPCPVDPNLEWLHGNHTRVHTPNGAPLRDIALSGEQKPGGQAPTPMPTKDADTGSEKEKEAIARKIDQLEGEIPKIEKHLERASIDDVLDLKNQLKAKEAERDKLYARWEELESDKKAVAESRRYRRSPLRLMHG